MTRLAEWLEGAALPIFVVVIVAIFARALPWIVAAMADDRAAYLIHGPING